MAGRMTSKGRSDVRKWRVKAGRNVPGHLYAGTKGDCEKFMREYQGREKLFLVPPSVPGKR
jgi:hypothetical protein